MAMYGKPPGRPAGPSIEYFPIILLPVPPVPFWKTDHWSMFTAGMGIRRRLALIPYLERRSVVDFILRKGSSRSPWRASIQPIVADLSDRAAGQKKDPGRSEEQKENESAATGKLREIGKRKAAEWLLPGRHRELESPRST